jgi:HAD superfamily hydrolase (TIGR01450 family)
MLAAPNPPAPDALPPEVEQPDHPPGPAYDGLILDLDGVFWVGEKPVEGAARAIAALRLAGIRVVFLTNEPARSRATIAERLSAMGIRAWPEEVITSAAATGQLLGSLIDLDKRTAFVIGPPALREEVLVAGFTLLSPEAARQAAVVVVGGHVDFDYQELRAATLALRSGARLYATGRDAVYPGPDGPWPGTGAILAAVETAGGVRATVVGKPEPIVFDIARKALLGCRRIAVVGDNLLSDVLGARRAGLPAILVLTGTTTRADLESASVRPDLVLSSLVDLPAALLSIRGPAPL